MAIELTAQRRSATGKSVKQLRAAGRLPGNVYGGSLTEALAVELDTKEAEKVIRANGKKAEYSLNVDGTTYPVRLQEVQFEPLRKAFIHVDFVVTNG
jgi:large subunit ribosomal protein L25